MKKWKFIKIAANPFLIAALFILASFPFVLNYIPKYKAIITAKNALSKSGGRLFWVDISNDGQSEKFEWFINSEGKTSWRIADEKDVLIDQQVFEGKSLALRNLPFFGDLNGNGFPEIVVFYHRNDSLFFRINEFNTSGKNIGNEVFTDLVSNPKGEFDYGIGYAESVDLDFAAHKDFIFTVSAGYPVFPRSVYIYNPETKQVKKSGFLGSVAGLTHVTDINNDGLYELFMTHYSIGNMKDTLNKEITDFKVNCLVLDPNFKPLFPSKPITGLYSSLESIPLFCDNEGAIVTFLKSKIKQNDTAVISKYTLKGELLAKNYLDPLLISFDYTCIFEKGKNTTLKFWHNEGLFFEYDKNLQLVSRKKINELKNFNHQQSFDIDDDGSEERIFISPLNEVGITRNDFSYPAFTSEAISSESVTYKFTLKKNKNRPNELSFQSGNWVTLVSYQKNPVYPFRFLFLLLIYILLSGFFLLLQFLQRLALKEKIRAERKMSEMQLLLMRNQLNPHFLFNAINSVSYRYMSKNPEKANEQIVRLSKLIRGNLLSSEKLSRTLKEELEAAVAYLEIVQSQCEQPFLFQYNLSPSVDTDIQVPVLIIQNYIENAFKHGIRSLGTNGQINLSVFQEKDYLHIEVSDNGIGRVKAAETAEKSNSTGKGMELMQQVFDVINRYNVLKISVIITDLLTAEGYPAGTHVKINIPVNLKYRFYD